MHPRVMTRHVLIAVTERKVRARTRVTGLTFFLADGYGVRHARTLIPEYTCHRCLSLTENAHASGRYLKTWGEHAIDYIFRISRRCFKQHFFQNCLKPLQNLPMLWQISITMDGVAISHDYCHESGLIYVSRTHSFHLSELSTGVRKFPSQRNYPPFPFFLFFFLSFFFFSFFFYKVHEIDKALSQLVHRINAPLSKTVNFRTSTRCSKLRKIHRVSHITVDILCFYKVPF